MDPNEYEPVPPRQRKKPKVKESIIDHTYRDYSQVEVSSDDEPPTADIDKKSSRLQPNFPAKLHAIVSNPNYQHIICWQPHGRSWKIVDKHLLSTVICPKHFAHAKFESFNRSVNGWGFKRLLNPGPDCKSYYHECFLRGRPELTKLMQRLVNPGKRLPDKAGEPDFYEISRKYPLPAAPAPSQEDLQNALGSPMGRGAGQAFPFQGAQAAGGYPYGYYQAGPYPQMPSPASGGYGGQPGFPPQPPQQSYWPNQMGQMPPGMYPPNPAAPYGYYPYPQMMAAPQGYEQYPHPAMYGQYGGYPGAPSAFNQPGASPGRAGAKPPADAQAAQQLDKQTGQYPFPQGVVPQTGGPANTGQAGADGAAADEQKPPAQTAGVKRDLEESQEGQGATEGTEAGEASKSAQEGAAAQKGGSTDSANPGSAASAKGAAPSSEGGSGNAPAPGSSPKKGDGVNEQQLLQDFFQHF